jgi:hypothetical protein
LAIEADIVAPLTLELDGAGLTPERFMRAVRHFFDLTKSVTDAVRDERAPVIWNVQVKAGSNLVGLVPDAEAPADLVAEIAAQLAAGAASLEQQAAEVSAFDGVAMKAVRGLGKVAGEGNLVRLWAASQPRPITQRTESNVTAILGGDYDEHGAVEGYVRTVSDDGGFKIVIKDEIWGNVRCHIDASQIDSALRHFGKRVEAYGLVRYSQEGRAKSVKVEEIMPFPDDSTLPTAANVRGIIGSGPR